MILDAKSEMRKHTKKQDYILLVKALDVGITQAKTTNI